MAGIWGVLLMLAVWSWIHESLTHFNNFLAGRPKDSPEGSPGCLYYIVLVGIIYVIALLSQ